MDSYGNRNRNGPESGTGMGRKAEQERTGRRNRNGPEAGAEMGRKPEQEPEWAGSRNMKRQKYRKRIAYNER